MFGMHNAIVQEEKALSPEHGRTKCAMAIREFLLFYVEVMGMIISVRVIKT